MQVQSSMERCDASIFAGGGDVRSGVVSRRRPIAGPAVSPRQLHRRPEQRQGQLAGRLCRRPGLLRLVTSKNLHRCQPATCWRKLELHPPDGVAHSWLSLLGSPQQHAAALAASSATTRNGTTSCSASRLNYIHGKLRSARQFGSRASFLFPTDLRDDSCTIPRASMKLSDFGSLRVRGGYAMGMLPALRVCRHCVGRPISPQDRRSFDAICRLSHSALDSAAGIDRQCQHRPIWSTATAPALGVDVMLCGGPVPARRMGISPLHVGCRHQHQHRSRRPRLQILIRARRRDRRR